MFRPMKVTSSASFVLCLLYIGLFAYDLKTISASLTEQAENRRQNLRQGVKKQQQVDNGNNDGEIETAEIASRSLIIGGEDAEDYPRSIVFLSNREDSLQCGGSLISPTVVLAAGHCEISLVHEAVFLRYKTGSPMTTSDEDSIPITSSSENEIRIKVKKEILHPDYDRNSLRNDVMLLVLERSPNEIPEDEVNTSNRLEIVSESEASLKISDQRNIIPMNVPYMKLHSPNDTALQDMVDAIEEEKGSSSSSSSSKSKKRNKRTPRSLQQITRSPRATDLQFTALGWGHTSDGRGGEPSDTLQEVQVNYVPNEECRKAEESEIVSYGDRIFDDMMCTWRPSMDTCHGDSGGPIVYENPDYKKNEDNEYRFIQVGIVSWGEDCADNIFPGVASRVSVAYEWIRDRVCSIDGAAAPGYLRCTDEHTYSPAPSMSPTTANDALESELRTEALVMINDGILSKIVETPPVEVVVAIYLDVYSSETAWKLIDRTTGKILEYISFKEYQFENEVVETFDLTRGHTYEFTIYDQYGDGIMNGGYYEIYMIGDDDSRTELVLGDGVFASKRSHTFTIPSQGGITGVQRIADKKKKSNHIGFLRDETIP